MLPGVSESGELARRLAALAGAPAGEDAAPAGEDAALVALPAGRLVHGEEGDDEQPAMWVSSGPASATLWAALHGAHERSGLWPLLLDHLYGDPSRPWDGELYPADMSSPADRDAETLLARWWADSTDVVVDDFSSAERRALTAPFEQRWPGLSAPLPLRHDPGKHAKHCVTEMLESRPALRLGLVATDRSSDAITAAGWQGAANFTNDTAELSAVLRSWEDRFGVRVIGAGFAEVYLSVAAPPRDGAEAIRVAAEHFAFCPDNIWQGATDLVRYAEQLVDAPMWSFWWD
jgi:hypothetical protein